MITYDYQDMNFKYLLSYIFPVTLFHTSTPFNRDIHVSLDHGEPKLLVNGSRQSGAYIRMLWGKAFTALPLPETVNKILVLGIGGGTVIKLLSAKYPTAQITGVDIDQTIINIANTYFALKKIPGILPKISSGISGIVNKSVTCHVADAAKFVPSEIRKGSRYDLVIVDLFSGREIPTFVSTTKFIQDIKLVMRPLSQFVINYLREREYAPRARAFRELLKQEFVEVNSFAINNNIFFSCV